MLLSMLFETLQAAFAAAYGEGKVVASDVKIGIRSQKSFWVVTTTWENLNVSGDGDDLVAALADLGLKLLTALRRSEHTEIRVRLEGVLGCLIAEMAHRSDVPKSV